MFGTLSAQAPAWALYDLLIERAALAAAPDAVVSEVLIGLTWTLCAIEASGANPDNAPVLGLAMSPGAHSRVLPWPGTLAGRRVTELTPWIRAWCPFESTIAMAAINGALAGASPLAGSATPLVSSGPANLAVFQHFAADLAGRRVVVVGRYPGLDSLDIGWDLVVLERQPGAGDLPDPAAEYLLPEADWVFLTGTSIPNKTFPRLAQLSRDARLVLMGPSVPWLEDLANFGVDYLAGVQVTDADRLRRTLAEGGGTRIFEEGVRYAVVNLALTPLDRLRQAIAHTAACRGGLTQAMDAWYGAGQSRRFPDHARLAAVDLALSDLDSRFKAAYDASLAG